MERVQIRSRTSKRKPSPRLFDALIDGDRISLEVKNGPNTEVIPLTDVYAQIAEAKATTASFTTEP